MSVLTLTDAQLAEYARLGHLTVPGLWDVPRVSAALDDLAVWAEQFYGGLSADAVKWYVEAGSAGRAAPSALRKLDHPVYHRAVFRELATGPPLSQLAEQLLQGPVCVFFSQVFLKPSEIGGPKPAHQDNFYFGPEAPDALVTAWVALDDATPENGCLHYVDGSHRLGVLPHAAPSDAPYNLQISEERLSDLELTPAPVPRGGVSIHHGNTIHCSGANSSRSPRRAVAIHYRRRDVQLTQPALEYDERYVVDVP